MRTARDRVTFVAGLRTSLRVVDRPAVDATKKIYPKIVSISVLSAPADQPRLTVLLSKIIQTPPTASTCEAKRWGSNTNYFLTFAVPCRPKTIQWGFKKHFLFGVPLDILGDERD